MDFMDAIYRRAVREFKKRRGKSGDDPLHHRCRRSGAERVNRQPWFFVVIEDQAALERYSCKRKGTSGRRGARKRAARTISRASQAGRAIAHLSTAFATQKRPAAAGLFRYSTDAPPRNSLFAPESS